MTHQQDQPTAEDYIALKWNDSDSLIAQACRDLRNTRRLLDVKIYSDKESNAKPLEAHKLVLAACSETFNRLIESHQEISGPLHPPVIIYLPEVSRKNLKNLINFMYDGEIKIKPKRLSTFLEAAQRLKIKGLTLEPPNQTPPTSNATQYDAESGYTALISSSNQVQPSTDVPQHSAMLSDITTNPSARNHITPNPSEENECDLEKIFLRHYKIKSYIRSKTYISKFCDKKKSRIFHCGICHKKGTKREIHQHIRNDHITTTPFPCINCGKEYMTKKELTKHDKEHHQMSVY